MRTHQQQQQAVLPGLWKPKLSSSLSRVLGGTMRNEQTAHLITDCELNELVRDLFRTVPDPQAVTSSDHSQLWPTLVSAASCASPMPRIPHRDSAPCIRTDGQ